MEKTLGEIARPYIVSYSTHEYISVITLLQHTDIQHYTQKSYK